MAHKTFKCEPDQKSLDALLKDLDAQRYEVVSVVPEWGGFLAAMSHMPGKWVVVARQAKA